MGIKITRQHKVNEPLLVIFNEKTEEWIPEFRGGRIPSIEQIKEVARSLTNFAEKYSDADIEAANKELELSTYLEKAICVSNPAYKPSPGWVYVMHEDGQGLHKIGMSANVAKRLKTIKASSPSNVTLVHTIQTNDMARAEATLHFQMKEYRVKGEWFCLPSTEVKKLTEIKVMNCEVEDQ